MSQPAQNPAPLAGPNYMAVDPNAIAIPTDAAGIFTFCQEIKDVLIAINHNLSEYMQVNGADLTTANTNMQAHEQSIQALETNMVTVTAQLSAISGTGGGTTTTGTFSQRTRAPKLTPPAKFDGTDKNKATSFRVAVSHYLRVSYPSSTVDEQIAFIISCLDGKAHEWLEPHLEQDVVSSVQVPWLHDLPAFWVQFNARWNVANKTENFRAKFKALKQTKSVQEYFKDFQLYSQGLGYNDQSLRDSFYDGLSIKIKETLMLQDYNHMDPRVSLQDLADKTLAIDQRLEAFQSQHGKSSNAATSTKTNTTSPSTASPAGKPRDMMTVGEKVYKLGPDGKARKGVLTGVVNAQGQSEATVKWSDGATSKERFKSLKKDAHPNTGPVAVVAPAPSSSRGPGPMDLDAAGKGKKPIVCTNCGGRGHYASSCPSAKSYSGQGAELSDTDSEKADL
ncbi:hypothetical protein FRC07_013331 [Ceratobasidium sp. 392]|nr:hypothetical protein FRC07_013331 [Ceratobasidium sp. 392]